MRIARAGVRASGLGAWTCQAQFKIEFILGFLTEDVFTDSTSASLGVGGEFSRVLDGMGKDVE